MRIDDAIKIAREHTGSLRKRGTWGGEIADRCRRDAEALETVVDTLEAFLQRQEEDNSYHSQGGRPHAD